MFSDAIDALGQALADVAGEMVIYTSAALNKTAPLVAVPGRSTINVQNTDGAILQVLSHDFLVVAGDLEALNVPKSKYKPAKGDTVTLVKSGSVYELMTPPFTPSDHLGGRLRLHSVRLS
jgi:hypothetical protein